MVSLPHITSANTEEPEPFVLYSQFGAKGDGKTDDIEAIIRAHAFANEHGLPVRADDGATYYIGGRDRTAIIRTNTDFGTAAFIIDDTDVENRRSDVFRVTSRHEPFPLEGITRLRRDQERIEATLPGPALIRVTDDKVRRYIRYGPNLDEGSPQTDVFLVDAEGNVDMDAPIIWDFDQITEITARLLDEETLTLRGGRFTTIANQGESKYTYYSRGIVITRSNVVVEGLEHRVTGEGEQGAPYSGFLRVHDSANVTIRDTVLTGRKTFATIGRAGTLVNMGTYGLLLTRSINVSLIRLTQTNDIHDNRYWGLMASNYCKNLILDHCVISRFDAHKGVANVTIRNSSLGYQGINAIGSGTFTLENSTVHSRRLINLRNDYGSTWRGDFVIRNSVFIPRNGESYTAGLIGGRNTGRHDFGYTCHMPRRITIDTLHIDDSQHPEEDYQGPAILADFNPELTDASYEWTYPYVLTEEVVLRNVTTASGKPLRLSKNPAMFRDVKVIHE